MHSFSDCMSRVKLEKETLDNMITALTRPHYQFGELRSGKSDLLPCLEDICTIQVHIIHIDALLIDGATVLNLLTFSYHLFSNR